MESMSSDVRKSGTPASRLMVKRLFTISYDSTKSIKLVSEDEKLNNFTTWQVLFAASEDQEKCLGSLFLSRWSVHGLDHEIYIISNSFYLVVLEGPVDLLDVGKDNFRVESSRAYHLIHVIPRYEVGDTR